MILKPGVQTRLNIRQIVVSHNTHRSLSEVKVCDVLDRQPESQVDA